MQKSPSLQAAFEWKAETNATIIWQTFLGVLNIIFAFKHDMVQVAQIFIELSFEYPVDKNKNHIQVRYVLELVFLGAA